MDSAYTANGKSDGASESDSHDSLDGVPDVRRGDDVGDLPPPKLGDERRMQVRAYNFWAPLAVDSRYPVIAALDNGANVPFADHAVILRLAGDGGDPAIALLGDDPEILHLGSVLADVSRDASGRLPARLSEVAPGSLLARLGNHLQRLLIARAPTSFDAEFVDARGCTMLCRGILLPFSSDGQMLDYAVCAINWKELADAATTAALRAEIGRLFDDVPAPPARRKDAPPARRTGAPPASRAMAGGGHWVQGPDRLVPPGTGDRATGLESSLTGRLRSLPAQPLAGLRSDGDEFALVMIRRCADGIALVGEVPGDATLLAHAGTRLLG